MAKVKLKLKNNMTREVRINENKFLSIFSDAVILYESATERRNEELKSALAKSSVLSVNYAIEAAANSFLKSIVMTDTLVARIDKFRTLEKFDFVLQWHSKSGLNLGDPHVQAIKNLISNRNAMVHPKVTVRSTRVNSSMSSDQSVIHNEVKPASKKAQDTKPKLLGSDYDSYTDKDARQALIAMTSFLNIFVERWWGIGYEQAELFLFQSWDGSINARPVMFLEHQIRALLRNDYFLTIPFMGIHNLVSEGSV